MRVDRMRLPVYNWRMDYICNTADRLELGCLTEFQGGLKQRTAEDIEKIKKSIHRHGFAFPFFVWSHGGVNHVLDGHGRIQALKQMEKDGEAIPPLPVVYIDCRDEAEAKELLLKLNSHYGQMTADSVLEFIGDIDINLDDLALPSGLLELGDIADTDDDGEVIEDEVPEEPEEPAARLGDVYRLGRHRLICGDSTDSETIARLMDGQKADMVFTDPPYNVAIGTKNDFLNTYQKAGSCTQDIVGDKGMTDEEAGEKLWKPAFVNMFENAKDNCAIYCTMPQGGTHMMMMMMMSQSGWQVKHELMWLKNSPTFSMGRLDYDYKHEPIVYGWKKTHIFYGKGKHTKSVWEIDKPIKCDLHPTMKPIELIVNAILNSSQKQDVVLDPFGGSGSTLIACEQTGRRCYICELDPRYIDVIIQRWETLTGEKAELLERVE